MDTSAFGVVHKAGPSKRELILAGGKGSKAATSQHMDFAPTKEGHLRRLGQTVKDTNKAFRFRR